MFRLLNLAKLFCTANTPPIAKHRYFFKYASAIVPHPQKAYKGGQDAVYASENILLVADGVGGWAQSGVDPALYSKKLVQIVEELVKKDKLKYILNPKDLIKEAVSLNKEVGSTTVCLMTLHPQTGAVNAYYLGDSVYAIINPTNQSYRVAPDQQYSFNFPVQVGTGGADPGQGIFHDYASSQILAEQVIVIGTDGIWDNLHDYMIYQVIADKNKKLQEKAQLLANLAKHYGTQKNYKSPFYVKAKEAGIEFPAQGKLDDNSIILAHIIKEQLL